MHEAKEAIEARTDLTAGEQADHLAVLWFVAEAEALPVRLMKEYIRQERLMESVLYREIKAEGKAEDVLTVLDARGVQVSAAVRARILGCKDPATLDVWLRRAVVTSTAASVVRTRAPARAVGPARHAPKT